MQPVQKKTRRAPRRNRLVWLALLLLLTFALLLAGHLLRSDPQPSSSTSVPQNTTLTDHDPGDVLSLTITRRGESPWQVVRDEEGYFVLQSDPKFRLSNTTTDELADVACILSCEEILSEDPAEYGEHLADYGLDDPHYIASIAYRDGTSVTLRVGSTAVHTNAWRYMTIDGDDRLFAFGRGMVENLFVSEASLREVEQPVLHKARINRITLTGPDGAVQAEWALTADITASDAIDRWQLTAPFVYPADATAMEGLLANAANLRLGTWLAPSTQENLTAYGFDAPRLSITLHMAAGTIAATDINGVSTPQDYPESSCTFLIGGTENDMIDYVRYGDSLYRCSHFTMQPFLDADPNATLSRYLLPVALGNLASLSIEQNGQRNVYVLTRTERVAENNDLVYNADGHVVHDITVTKNGAPMDYARFEAAYQSLVTATVSGILPQDAPAAPSPHTVFTFADTDGSRHTVALSSFDALHDTVIVDGHEAFYLIKGGFRLNIE